VCLCQSKGSCDLLCLSRTGSGRAGRVQDAVDRFWSEMPLETRCFWRLEAQLPVGQGPKRHWLRSPRIARHGTSFADDISRVADSSPCVADANRASLVRLAERSVGTSPTVSTSLGRRSNPKASTGNSYRLLPTWYGHVDATTKGNVLSVPSLQPVAARFGRS
jgi:hypothetical protein